MGRGQNSKITSLSPSRTELPGSSGDGNLYVYGIEDPRDNEIKYIGITNNPKRRLSGHKNNPNNILVAFLREELLEEGQDIKMVMLTDSIPKEDAVAKEIELIKSNREQLFNLSSGGETGGSEIIWTEEEIVKSVKMLSDKVYNDNETYPRRKDFNNFNLRGLEESIRTRTKGHSYIAELSGLKRVTYFKWDTFESRKAGVIQLVSQLKINRYPRLKEFRANSLGSLSNSIIRNEGHDHMADSVNLKRDKAEIWDSKEKRVARVREFVETNNFDYYPSQKEFLKNNLSGLYRSISKNAEHDEIAKELSLKRNKLKDWSDKATRKESVQELIKNLEISRYPTQKEFNANGLGGLYNSIAANEGHSSLSETLGLSKVRQAWSDKETCLKGIKTLIEKTGKTGYPTQKDFRENSLSGLHSSIERNPNFTHADLAEELGLDYKKNSQWTQDVAADKIKDLIDKLDINRYPTKKEFESNGLGGMYYSIGRMPGGHKGMRESLGVTNTAQRNWSQRTDREQAVKDLVEKLNLDRYPSQRHFNANDLSGLYVQIRTKYGGHDSMAQALGLRR